MPEGPIPPQGAPQPEQPDQGGGGGGGGIVEVLTQTDKNLFQIAKAVSANGQIPDEIKQAFQTALESFRQGLQAMTGGGGAPGGQPPQGEGPGVVSPEQGASGAQPMSMRRPG